MMRNQKGEQKGHAIPIHFVEEDDERDSRKAASMDASTDEGREPSADAAAARPLTRPAPLVSAVDKKSGRGAMH